MQIWTLRSLVAAVVIWAGLIPAGAQAAGETVVLEDALVIGSVGRGRRSAVHTDAIEARIVAGTWSPPREGGRINPSDGKPRLWKAAEADENGWFAVDRGGYAYFEVESDRERAMILHARGHSLVYVNGELRAGDPYNTGFVRLPVLLTSGRNELLFRVGRGRLWARLLEPGAPVTLDTGDLTLPDLVRGEAWSALAGIVVVNASGEPLEGLTIMAGGDGLAALESDVPPVAPYTIRKVPFWCGGAVAPDRRECTLQVRLLRGGQVLDEKAVLLRVVGPTDRHRRTLRSAIDGTVQYYAVTPMRPTAGSTERPALFLTLHGAGVEAKGQAAAYRAKAWGHVVAPTNRRPFGFDWEDWGRLDTIEVLEHATRIYDVDPDRIYLTGHSMGGHGVWNFGATYPDRFAAIGPSAGWTSFWSYGGAPSYDDPDAIEAMLTRAASDSDTLALSRNYLHSGVYILHGEKDDNVPVEQSRQMYAQLAEFHPDVVYHEQPGAGHWWGNRCVDWPAMFEFFNNHRRTPPTEVDHVEFVTANPAVSARSGWVTIEAVVSQGVAASITVDRDRGDRRFDVITDNVGRFALALDDLTADSPVDVVIDGQTLSAVAWPAKKPRLWIARDHDEWRVLDGPVSKDEKGPHRAGPFKHAFRNRMQFVYGTQGTDEENTWAFNKARFDAETFWYRGNGAVDLVADVDFDPAAERDRSVIVYGNADGNAAWEPLLGDSPVDVRRGYTRIGNRRLDGTDLACLFIRPRPGSDTASVGVVTGTGGPGMRLTGRLRYFLSGVAYPDLVVIGPGMLTSGTAGVRVAGFFGQDWSVENGDLAWRRESE